MTKRSLAASTVVSESLPLRVALWLLEQPGLGQTSSVKRLAGHLLKHPARAGVVSAQSRLGRLLCLDCASTRDRRIGVNLLRQAARAGDCQARVELGQLLSQPRHYEPGQARHWLELAVAQGSEKARTLLMALPGA